MSRARRAALMSVLAVACGVPLAAQTLPSEPVVLANGRVSIGGDVSVSYGCASPTPEQHGCADDTGFFNYTDYEHSALRMLQIDVRASLRANDHLMLLGDLRSENGEAPHPYAFYLRVRPWTTRNFDIQAGRVPPTFGAFARRIYASDNLLIGYPLAYQYLTSLRPDALPMDADELLRMRGRGWLANYSLGNLTPDRGMPLVSAFRWDTGVQVHGGGDVVDATASVTTGTVGNPLFKDDNSGPQLAGRVAFHPSPGLRVGVSAARGPFVTRTAARGAVGDGHDGEFTQTALGGEAEYSRDYYLVRGEMIFSEWKVPTVSAPLVDVPLRALATYVEGRYKIRPGLYAAARVDHLGFSELTGSLGRHTWEAPVTRVEIGGGYALQRNLLLKGSFQRNTRRGGRVLRSNFGTAQIVYWF